MVDATTPLERQDLTIARLVAQEGRALVIVLNKWDLIADPNATMTEIRHTLTIQLADVRGVPCVPLSALTGRNVDKLLPAVVAAHARWDSRVPTAALNRWLAAALEQHPPPLAQGRRVKIRYATQSTARPPTFILFANKPAEALPDSYLRYLAAGLREIVRPGRRADPLPRPARREPLRRTEPAARSRRCARQVGSSSSSNAGAACGGRRHRAGPLARIGLGAQPRRHRSRIEQVDPHLRQPQLGRVGQDQRLQRGLGRGVAAPDRRGPGPAPPSVTNTARPAGAARSSGSRLRIRRWLATRLTARSRSKVLGSRWLTGVIVPSSAAQATSPSSRPKRSNSERPSASTSSPLVRSSAASVASAPPARRQASSTSSSAPRVRAARTSLAPSRRAGRRPRRHPGRARRR